MNREICEKNREAWNEATVYHQKARNNSLQEGFKNSDFTTLDRDCDDIFNRKIKQNRLKG
jgi:hypothetical protein